MLELKERDYIVIVRAFPETVTNPESGAGTTTKTVLIRTTKPSPESGLPEQQFITIDVMRKSERALDKDLKPHTENLFSNTHKGMFEAIIRELYEGGDTTKEVRTDKGNQIFANGDVQLKESMPGLVITFPVEPYYVTEITKEGKRIPRKVSKKNADGTWTKDHLATATTVRRFLFPGQVNEMGLLIAENEAKASIKPWLVTGNTTAEEAAEAQNENTAKTT